MTPEEKALALLRKIATGAYRQSAYYNVTEADAIEAVARDIVAEADRATLLPRARDILAKHCGDGHRDKPADHPLMLAMVEALESRNG